eukprot:bmy_00815T0
MNAGPYPDGPDDGASWEEIKASIRGLQGRISDKSAPCGQSRGRVDALGGSLEKEAGPCIWVREGFRGANSSGGRKPERQPGTWSPGRERSPWRNQLPPASPQMCVALGPRAQGGAAPLEPCAPASPEDARKQHLDTPHPTLRGLQEPLPLEKPSQPPPTFLQGRQGESPAWNAQGQGPGLQPPSLELPSPARPCNDTGATQEPLRDSGGDLGNTWSRESNVPLSPQHSSLERGSDVSRLSSGYAGDEENSQVSLLGGSSRIVRLNRSLRTQAGGAQTSQVCATYSPNQLKSRLASQADSTVQTGREK